jgi:hypothetical protein
MMPVSGIALASPHPCEADIYEWDDATGKVAPKFQLQLTRPAVAVNEPAHQLHPASAVLSNDTGVGAEPFVGQLKQGVIVATASVTAIVQNGSVGLSPNIRSQNGAVTTSIINQADETLMLGWTPDRVRAEIATDANELLRRRRIDAGGTETRDIA